MVESSFSALSIIILYTSSDNKGAFLPVLGFTYLYKSSMVSENDFLVFLCRLDTAILAASFA